MNCLIVPAPRVPIPTGGTLVFERSTPAFERLTLGLHRAARSFALAAGAALACAMSPAFAQADASPVGLWKTVDDETRQAKALVRMVEKDGVLTGRIERILTDRADARCDLCTDDRKGRPVLGMTIIEGMKRDRDHWDGGHILDPNNGKVYRSRLKLTDGGRRLEVRGYIGAPMLGRTQTWQREE